MKLNANLRRGAGNALLASARTSQALVIDVVDRVAGAGDVKAPRLVRRFGRVHAGVPPLLLEGPARVVDDGYELLERLIALHREFAQRMFDAISSNDDDRSSFSGSRTGRVLPFRSQGHESAP